MEGWRGTWSVRSLVGPDTLLGPEESAARLDLGLSGTARQQTLGLEEHAPSQLDSGREHLRQIYTRICRFLTAICIAVESL
jgi:hypothetical protein